MTSNTGEEHDLNCNWRKAQHFTLSSNTTSVTITAQKRYLGGGILASFGNDVVTDESWQCADLTSCKNAGCETNPKWRQAVSFGFNNRTVARWGTFLRKAISGIRSKAQWIWVSDQKAQIVWCMITFSK